MHNMWKILKINPSNTIRDAVNCFNKCFTRERIRTLNKQMKMCSTAIAMRQMRFKITLIPLHCRKNSKMQREKNKIILNARKVVKQPLLYFTLQLLLLILLVEIYNGRTTINNLSWCIKHKLFIHSVTHICVFIQEK